MSLSLLVLLGERFEVEPLGKPQHRPIGKHRLTRKLRPAGYIRFAHEKKRKKNSKEFRNFQLSSLGQHEHHYF